MTDYSVARIIEGVGLKNDFEIIRNFEAANDDAANEYAATNYPNEDWYVLDGDGNNINA